jgi:hypothetical protein
MASYLPPTETLPIFDNTVFVTNNTTALTYADAKKLFITFPTAQATSTIADLITGAISYLTPAAGSFFNIGTNQVSGGTIRIGPTGVSGVSVHAGNIDCTNNTINNATDAAQNNISLGNLQTSGVLNIGTGSRTTGGTINIGTGSGAIANPIIMGGAGTVTTFTNGLTQASGKYITTSHIGTITAPTSSQVGGVVTGTDISGPTFPTSGNITSWASITLPAGTWVVTGTRRYDSSASSTRILWSFGPTLKNNVAQADSDFSYGVTSCVLNTTNNFVTLTSTVSFTTDTTIYFNIYAQYTVAPSVSTTSSSLKAIRIA